MIKVALKTDRRLDSSRIVRSFYRLLGAGLFLLAPVALTQSTAVTPKLPAWDVVSVRPHSADDGGMSIAMLADGTRIKGITLRLLLANAYGLRQELVLGGPAWLDSAHFDIQAKVAASDVDAWKALTVPQKKMMLRNLLRDRFQWQGHAEIKQLPVYDLVIAKGGSKLKASVPGDTYEHGLTGADGSKAGAGTMIVMSGKLIAQAAPIADLVQTLSSEVERGVIDKTGLKGDFDITLTWSTQDGASQGSNGSGDESEASLFTALQDQLGLKLMPSKGPVNTVVVDHIEKPAEN